MKHNRQLRYGTFRHGRNTLADRQARRAAKLKIDDDALTKILKSNSERLDNLRRIAETLHETLSETTRAAPLEKRGENGASRKLGDW